MPKLASKILCWLDPQKDDVILDIGCGGEPPPRRHLTLKVVRNARKLTQLTSHIITVDAVLDIQIAQILAQGKGRLHGIDSSKAMIAAARKKAEEDDAARGRCTFEGEKT